MDEQWIISRIIQETDGDDGKAVVMNPSDAQTLMSLLGDTYQTGEGNSIAGVPLFISILCPVGSVYITDKDQAEQMANNGR